MTVNQELQIAAQFPVPSGSFDAPDNMTPADFAAYVNDDNGACREAERAAERAAEDSGFWEVIFDERRELLGI